MTRQYVTVDGTVWPVNVGEIEWQLRYGHVSQPLVAASVVNSYAYLTDPSISQATAIAALKRARKAQASA